VGITADEVLIALVGDDSQLDSVYARQEARAAAFKSKVGFGMSQALAGGGNLSGLSDEGDVVLPGVARVTGAVEQQGRGLQSLTGRGLEARHSMMLLGAATGESGRSFMEAYYAIRMFGPVVGTLAAAFLIGKQNSDKYKKAMTAAKAETLELDKTARDLAQTLGHGAGYHESANGIGEQARTQVAALTEAATKAQQTFHETYKDILGLGAAMGEAYDKISGNKGPMDAYSQASENLSRYDATGDLGRAQSELEGIYERQLELKHQMLAVEIEEHDLLMSSAIFYEKTPEYMQHAIDAEEGNRGRLRAKRNEAYKSVSDKLYGNYEGDRTGNWKEQLDEQAANAPEVIELDKQIRESEKKSRQLKESQADAQFAHDEMQRKLGERVVGHGGWTSKDEQIDTSQKDKLDSEESRYQEEKHKAEQAGDSLDQIESDHVKYRTKIIADADEERRQAALAEENFVASSAAHVLAMSGKKYEAELAELEEWFEKEKEAHKGQAAALEQIAKEHAAKEKDIKFRQQEEVVALQESYTNRIIGARPGGDVTERFAKLQEEHDKAVREMDEHGEKYKGERLDEEKAFQAEKSKMNRDAQRELQGHEGVGFSSIEGWWKQFSSGLNKSPAEQEHIKALRELVKATTDNTAAQKKGAAFQ
jgi:hypothetical protein